MNRLNLLIADGMDEFAAALTAILQDTYQIHRCSNGKDALDYLLHFQPDVLILDLMIPELDGITLLHMAAGKGVCPMVLAASRLLNDYVVEEMKELNVGYFMLKPCDPLAAAERVRDLSRRIHPRKDPPADPIQFTRDLLNVLNVPSHLRGTPFLREAILFTAKHPDISITKELYPAVGNAFGANYSQVERAIRNAINMAWEHRDNNVWRQYFHTAQDGSIPRPSNGVFICRLAEELRQHTGSTGD